MLTFSAARRSKGEKGRAAFLIITVTSATKPKSRVVHRAALVEPLGKLGGFVCFPTRQPQPMSPHRGAALGPLGGFSLG